MQREKKITASAEAFSNRDYGSDSPSTEPAAGKWRCGTSVSETCLSCEGW